MPAARRVPDLWWLFLSPSGRVGRQIFILGWLFWLMVTSFATAMLVLNQNDPLWLDIWGTVFVAVAVSSIVASVMMTIKRLHDVGLPGMLSICLFIPAFSIVMLIALFFWPSNEGPNAYGGQSDWPV